MANPAGEAESGALRLDFDRRLTLQFRGSVVTSDAEFVAETAARLCAAKQVAIYPLENQVYRFAIGFGLTPAYREIEKRQTLVPGPSRIPEPVQR